jgi:hemolysin-activating ACP:hemolysin acyltransferase
VKDIIKLFQTFDKYKDNSYQELYYHILPSINLNQYKTFKDEKGLYGFVNWAKLDNKDEDQYNQTGFLYKSQWNSGKNIWLYDIVIIRKTKEVMRWVYNYFKGYLEVNQPINWLRLDKQNNIYRVSSKYKREFHI